MMRFGFSWGRVNIGPNRCLHVGIDHHKRALGDGLKRVGVQVGIIYDDSCDVRGLHIAPYYIGPKRNRAQAYAATLLTAILFALAVYAMQQTDVPDTKPTTTITLGN